MRGAGGCDFAVDPALDGREASVVWSARVDPGTLLLTNDPLDDSGASGGPSPLLSLSIAAETSAVIQQAGAHFPAIFLSPAHQGGPAAVLLLDEDLLDRAAAVIRFWHAQHWPSVSPDQRVTQQRRKRLRDMAQVFDGRRAGATYRVIAELLFPQHRTGSAAWVGSAVRETTIRLARDGKKLVEGGYAALLRRSRKS